MDSLTIKVATGKISGQHPTKSVTVSQYYAKIKIENSVDMLPFILYHYYYHRIGEKVTIRKQKFVNKLYKITIGTPTPIELFKTILPLIAIKICKYHYPADDIGLAIAKAIAKKYNYSIEKQDYTPDMIKIKLIPR